MAVLQEEKSTSVRNVTALQDPPSASNKKRKKYVLLAVNEQFDSALQKALVTYLEKKISLSICPHRASQWGYATRFESTTDVGGTA